MGTSQSTTGPVGADGVTRRTEVKTLIINQDGVNEDHKEFVSRIPTGSVFKFKAIKITTAKGEKDFPIVNAWGEFKGLIFTGQAQSTGGVFSLTWPGQVFEGKFDPASTTPFKLFAKTATGPDTPIPFTSWECTVDVEYTVEIPIPPVETKTQEKKDEKVPSQEATGGSATITSPSDPGALAPTQIQGVPTVQAPTQPQGVPAGETTKA
jgi:hypothetical protein